MKNDAEVLNKLEKQVSREHLEKNGWLPITTWFRYEIWRNENKRLLLCPVEAEVEQSNVRSVAMRLLSMATERYQVHLEYEV